MDIRIFKYEILKLLKMPISLQLPTSSTFQFFFGGLGGMCV